VLEKAAVFRDGGQNVDVRGIAHDVLDRMGLTETIKKQNTTETGTVLVSGSGAVIAELPSDGPDGATAELEILHLGPYFTGEGVFTLRGHAGGTTVDCTELFTVPGWRLGEGLATLALPILRVGFARSLQALADVAAAT